MDSVAATGKGYYCPLTPSSFKLHLQRFRRMREGFWTMALTKFRLQFQEMLRIYVDLRTYCLSDKINKKPYLLGIVNGAKSLLLNQLG